MTMTATSTKTFTLTRTQTAATVILAARLLAVRGLEDPESAPQWADSLRETLSRGIEERWISSFEIAAAERDTDGTLTVSSFFRFKIDYDRMDCNEGASLASPEQIISGEIERHMIVFNEVVKNGRKAGHERELTYFFRHTPKALLNMEEVMRELNLTHSKGVSYLPGTIIQELTAEGFDELTGEGQVY